MGLQTKILKRTETFTLADGKKFTAGTAALIGGTPGQIYDVAYGPVVHTTTLAAAADIGSFVEGQGVIINAPEYALYGTGIGQGAALAPSLTLPTGTVVSCMTAGHVWIQRKYLDTILAKMNAAIIWQQVPENADDSSADTDNDLLVVEVNGMKAYGPDDSTANG
jgi:hypothetical protein